MPPVGETEEKEGIAEKAKRLTKMAVGKESPTAANSKAGSSAPSDTGSNSGFGNNLAGASGGSPKLSASSGTSTSGGLEDSRLANAARVVLKFSGQHKKSLGGTVVTIATVILLGSPAFGAFELLHIFSNEYQHVRGDINREINKEAAKVEDKLVQKIAQRASDKAAGKPTTDTTADAEDSDGPLNAEADKVNLSVIDPELEAQGITPTFDPDGNLTGLEDAKDGEDLTEGDLESGTALDGANATDIVTGLDQAASIPDLDNLTNYRALMADDAGVSFQVLPTEDSSDENVDQILEEKVQQGASDKEINDIATATEEDNGPPKPDPNNPTESAAATKNYEDTKADSGPLGDAVTETENDFKSGESSAISLQNGVDKFEGETADNDLSVVGPLTTACILKDGIVDASKQRVREMVTLLMRHGNILLTVTSQLKEGKLTGKAFGAFMKLFGGNSSVKPTKDDPNPEEADSVYSSAAYQRATNRPVTSANPDLDPLANPVADPKSQLINTVDSHINALGGGVACGALTSPFGFIIQGLVGIGQIIVSAPEGESPEIADALANAAEQAAFIQAVLPPVLKYITNLSITGTEDAVQWFNITDAGLMLSTSDYARSLGGVPMTNSQLTQANIETQNQVAAQESQQPLLHQMFATDDSDSFLSKLVIRLPLDPKAWFGSIMGSLFTTPHVILSNIGNIITPANADSTDTANPYGFTMYGFTDSEIGQYDVFQNEDYLRHTMVSLPSGPVSLIDILGDPTTYVASPAGDPNNDTCANGACQYDLLHCFVNSPDSFVDSNYDETDPDCGNVNQLIPNENPNAQPITQADLVDIACHYKTDQTGNGCNPNLPPVATLLVRYRQYMLDTRIMNNLVSLTNAD